MSYLPVRDRPIEAVLYRVKDTDLWSVRLPGGGYHTGGRTEEDALNNAYLFLNQWRNYPYELSTHDPGSFHSAIAAMKTSKRKVKNFVRIVRGQPRGIAERF